MFGISSFFFFFQLLNNWPSSLFYVWDSTIKQATIEVEILQPFNRSQPQIINSVEDFRRIYRLTYFSICGHLLIPSDGVVEWTLSRGDVVQQTVRGSSCRVQFYLIHQDTYRCSVTVKSSNGSLIGSGSTELESESMWIAIVGDSYASAEGNPEQPRTSHQKAKWMDEDCHRSRKSFAWQVANNIANSKQLPVYVSFLACSGTTTTKGLLHKTTRSSQLEVLESIAYERGKGPDLLFLTVGANDIGFGDVLHSLQRKERDTKSYSMRFFYLAHQMDQIRSRLRSMNVEKVVLPLYYDITRNENGVVDASCSAIDFYSTSKLEEAEKNIFQLLNGLLLKKATEFNWIVVNSIPKLFSTRGICSKHSLILSTNQSITIQGTTSGAFHPNEEGHRLIAEEVMKVI